MKLLIVTLFSLVVNACISQTMVLPVAKETTVQEDPNSDKVCKLTFKLLDRPPASSVVIKFKDFDDGTASKDKDYSYATASTLNSITISDAGSQEFSVDFKVMKDNLKETQEYFNLYVSYDRGGFAITEKIKITIDDAENKKKSAIDTSKWTVRLITGGNFDFFEGPLFKNFAGELHAFIPRFFPTTEGKKDKKTQVNKWGLQAGIFNYKYFESDSSRGRMIDEKYLADPTVTRLLADSTKYVREIYGLNSQTTYSNWGAYLNPMYWVNGNDWYDMYLNFHFEGIWRTRQITNTKAVIRKDTLKVTANDLGQPGTVFQAFPRIRALYSEANYYDVYFGIGLPIRINVKNAFEFYVNPTVGLTNFSRVVVERQVIDKIETTVLRSEVGFTPFALTKFQLMSRLAPIDLVIGGEFRIIAGKQFDKSPAYKAIYLGAVIGLDKLKR